MRASPARHTSRRRIERAMTSLTHRRIRRCRRDRGPPDAARRLRAWDRVTIPQLGAIRILQPRPGKPAACLRHDQTLVRESNERGERAPQSSRFTYERNVALNGKRFAVQHVRARVIDDRQFLAGSSVEIVCHVPRCLRRHWHRCEGVLAATIAADQ